MSWVTATTSVGKVALDPAIGNIRQLEFLTDGRKLSPLHTAPWAVASGPVDPTLSPLEARLAGDFLCAPFGAADLEDEPAHGWSANSAWLPDTRSPSRLSFVLERCIRGARFSKTLALDETEPLLYQTHLIEGGEGTLTVAHHPMIRLAGRGTLTLSPKRAVLTPATPLEPGRNRLALGNRIVDLSNCPTQGGGTISLHDLPIGDAHEDFLTCVEEPGAALGWTAVVRDVEDDIVFVLKDPAVLPVTMLWHSNGGRDYAPWNGSHTGVLGIEDGCTAGALLHSEAVKPNPVSAEGVPTVMTLGKPIRIAHVIGAVPRPAGWKRIASISAAGGELTLAEANGETLSMAFDTDFFKQEP
ncbi:MAG: hypothetical protein NXI27_23290 [Alphaproteobacteria bacterium]|nr:hypothetical protein [Alphaproteobacteria bacterium]